MSAERHRHELGQHVDHLHHEYCGECGRSQYSLCWTGDHDTGVHCCWSAHRTDIPHLHHRLVPVSTSSSPPNLYTSKWVNRNVILSSYSTIPQLRGQNATFCSDLLWRKWRKICARGGFFSGQTSVFSKFFDLLLRVDDRRKDSYIVLDYFFQE